MRLPEDALLKLRDCCQTTHRTHLPRQSAQNLLIAGTVASYFFSLISRFCQIQLRGETRPYLGLLKSLSKSGVYPASSRCCHPSSCIPLDYSGVPACRAVVAASTWSNSLSAAAYWPALSWPGLAGVPPSPGRFRVPCMAASGCPAPKRLSARRVRMDAKIGLENRRLVSISARHNAGHSRRLYQAI